MSFVALDADGTPRKEAMTTVNPAGAARYLGVWFSFTGPADGEHGRWSAQVAQLQGITQKFFKTCLGLSPSFSQLSEVVGNTLIRRLLSPMQGGIPVWGAVPITVSPTSLIRNGVACVEHQTLQPKPLKAAS